MIVSVTVRSQNIPFEFTKTSALGIVGARPSSTHGVPRRGRCNTTKPKGASSEGDGFLLDAFVDEVAAESRLHHFLPNDSQGAGAELLRRGMTVQPAKRLDRNRSQVEIALSGLIP